MAIVIEEAEPKDLRAIMAMDPQATIGSPRHRRVRSAIDARECLVARGTSGQLGYVIASQSFFDRLFIEILIVDARHRRAGVATKLIEAVIARCTDTKLFTSTNESNRAAQLLFEGLGFLRSGLIENLDDDDPELVYMLRIER